MIRSLFQTESDGLDSFYKLIWKNVKKMRQQIGLSQLQLANLIGHDSVWHIAKAELNKYGKRFNLEQLYKISIALDVDIKSFFDGAEKPNNLLK